MTEDERAKLRIFQSTGGYPVNWYGGPSEWAQNWSTEQRALGRVPTWRDFIEAAKATGWPAVQVPGRGGTIPLEFLEWLPSDQGKDAGGVYFVEIRGRVKIGVTYDFASRFKTLQSGSPDRLSVLLTLWRAHHAHERALHDAFWEYRLNGEWFDLVLPIQQFIAWAKSQLNEQVPPAPKLLGARAAQFVDNFRRVDTKVVHLVTKRSA